MQHDISSELRKRITEPEQLAKFEDFFRRYNRRMTTLGPDAGSAAMLEATRKCWRRAFGVDWPKTRADT